MTAPIKAPTNTRANISMATKPRMWVTAYAAVSALVAR
jgi:hypothetical protein